MTAPTTTTAPGLPAPASAPRRAAGPRPGDARGRHHAPGKDFAAAVDQALRDPHARPATDDRTRATGGAKRRPGHEHTGEGGPSRSADATAEAPATPAGATEAVAPDDTDQTGYDTAVENHAAPAAVTVPLAQPTGGAAPTTGSPVNADTGPIALTGGTAAPVALPDDVPAVAAEAPGPALPGEVTVVTGEREAPATGPTAGTNPTPPPVSSAAAVEARQSGPQTGTRTEADALTGSDPTGPSADESAADAGTGAPTTDGDAGPTADPAGPGQDAAGAGRTGAGATTTAPTDAGATGPTATTTPVGAPPAAAATTVPATAGTAAVTTTPAGPVDAGTSAGAAAWRHTVATGEISRAMSADNGGVTVRVDAADLGPVEIHTQVSNGQVDIRLDAARADTHATIDRNLRALQADLEAGGVATGNLESRHRAVAAPDAGAAARGAGQESAGQDADGRETGGRHLGNAADDGPGSGASDRGHRAPLTGPDHGTGSSHAGSGRDGARTPTGRNAATGRPDAPTDPDPSADARSRRAPARLDLHI